MINVKNKNMKQEVYLDLEKENQPDLYDWFFHKGLDGNWAAVPRDMMMHYLNYYECPNVIRSSQLSTVIELAGKVRHDPDFLKKIQ